MTRNNEIARAVRRVLITSAVAATAATAPVHAQDQDQDVSTVTVTGTRIVAPNLESISPVATISSEALSSTGKVRIEDVVNQLPQAFAAQGSNVSNGSDGTASVDLRGLGSQRTLVLVNGRRLMPGDPDGGNAADLNQIPLALVKRVDVLTGGASSVYGADAVAGVVNFIMDDEFQGIRIDTNYSFNQHHNSNGVADIVRARGFATPDSNVTTGYTRDITVAMGIGGADQPGHATFYASYRKVDPVLQANFDYSACALGSSDSSLPVAQQQFSCAGSSTSVPGRFLAVDAGGNIATDDTIGPGNTLVPFGASNLYNYGPLNYYQRPDERYTLGAFMKYDVAENAHVYGEAMFMDDRSVAQIAPSGSFVASHNINCNNPLLSAAMVQAWCTDLGLGPNDFTTMLIGRRNVEGGGRQNDLGHESYRLVMGVRGGLGSSWTYDTYVQHGETKRNSTYLNDFSITRIERALQVGLDGSGNPACLSALDGTDLNCVPWNIFQVGGVTPEALAYLQTPGLIRATATQRVAHADFSGDLSDYVKLPTAASGLAVNFGVEWREEKTEFRPDLEFTTGDLAGQGGATTEVVGGFNVKEAFMEARIPIVDDKPGAKSVAFETGYRYSDYSTGFNTDTYKFGADWAPVTAVRLRGSFQHAVRAPNVGELFSPQSVALDGTTDPCDGVPTATLAQCQLTGMTAAQYGTVPQNPAAQYNGLLGGNPDLKPESSDTVSFGVVYRPDFANLSVALDYFDIKVDDTIVPTIGGFANAYINECLSTGNASVCSLIHRDSLGSLWILPTGYIEDTSLNVGSLSTKGIDVQANYAVEIGAHKLAFNLVGTHLKELKQQLLPTRPAFECVGLYGPTCGVVAPKWRHSLRTDWTTPWRGLDVSLTWRYFQSVDLETTSSDPQLAGDVPATDRHFGSRSYLDLTGAIRFADNYTFRLGINNLLDKDPPLVGADNCPAGPCNGNAWAQTYDVLGRQWFATFTIDF